MGLTCTALREPLNPMARVWVGELFQGPPLAGKGARETNTELLSKELASFGDVGRANYLFFLTRFDCSFSDPLAMLKWC